MVVILNLYYFGLGLYHQLDVPTMDEVEHNLIIPDQYDKHNVTEPTNYQEIIIVDTRTKSIPIRAADILCITGSVIPLKIIFIL